MDKLMPLSIHMYRKDDRDHILKNVWYSPW